MLHAKGKKDASLFSSISCSCISKKNCVCCADQTQCPTWVTTVDVVPMCHSTKNLVQSCVFWKLVRHQSEQLFLISTGQIESDVFGVVLIL